MRPPTILVAPGPFKECLTSKQVCAAMTAGVLDVLPDASVIQRPLADGGSGFAKLLTEATNGSFHYCEVETPIGEKVVAEYGILGDGQTAVIESATAAGLALVPRDKRDPRLTTTYGVGQLILAAARMGVSRVLLGCGDSGTNDCGVGCASALGVCFLDSKGNEVSHRPAGGDLEQIAGFRLLPEYDEIRDLEITVACNLTSVLGGSEGTSIVYGPQKGASPSDVVALHRGVERFCEFVRHARGMDLAFAPGAGGSGGLAASLYAFFGAKLRYSIDIVDQYLNIDDYLRAVDLVITGEGCVDDRTASGKIACGLALKAKKFDVPVVAIAGLVAANHDEIFYNGIDAVESIAPGPISLSESIASAEPLIRRAAERVTRFWLLGNRSKGAT